MYQLLEPNNVINAKTGADHSGKIERREIRCSRPAPRDRGTKSKQFSINGNGLNNGKGNSINEKKGGSRPSGGNWLD